MFFFWLFILSLVTVVIVIFLLMRYLKEETDKSNQKNTLLKKQMTSNIAHELRTPVTSIRGYLETLLACPDMPQERKNVFIERAYHQTLRLSELISDMALISKLEENSSNFRKEGFIGEKVMVITEQTDNSSLHSIRTYGNDERELARVSIEWK